MVDIMAIRNISNIAYSSVGWFAGVAFIVLSHSLMLTCTNCGVQDKTCSSGQLLLRDLSSASWIHGTIE